MNPYKIDIHNVGTATEVVFSVEDRMIMVFQVSREFRCYAYILNLLSTHPNSVFYKDGSTLQVIDPNKILEIFLRIEENLSTKGVEIVQIFKSVVRKEKISKLNLDQ